MATTGRLGTAASQPGNLQPGSGGTSTPTISGTGPGSATASATLIRVGTVAATTGGSATATGGLTRIKLLAGAAAGAASGLGTANTGAHLQATARGGGTVTGTITGIRRIAGTAAGSAFAFAQPFGATHLAAVAAGSAQVSGTLNRYRYVSASASGSGSGSGSLVVALKHLAGAARGSATARGGLTGVSHAVTFLEVEIPAFYVDGVTMTAPDSPAIVNLLPDIDEGRGKGPPAPATTWIEADLIDFGTDGIAAAQTSLTVNGVSAVVGGVVQAGFEGALTVPSTDTLHIRVRPVAAFSSSQAITVVVTTQTNTGAPASRTWMFDVADTIPPAVYGALAIEQTRVRVTWDEEVPIANALDAFDALNATAYRLAYVQTDPLVPAVGPNVIGVVAVTEAGTAPTIVDLVLDVPMTSGVTYRLTASGIADVAGNVQATTQITFASFALPRPAGRDFDLWSMLPRMNRLEDATGDLRRFVACLQEAVDVQLYGIDRFPDIFDPDVAPEVFVDAMLADLGNPFPFVLDLVKKRQLVKLLVPLYKQKGTRAGILAAIRFFVELELTITTYTGTDMRLGLSRLGEDWILGPGNAFALYAFTIVSPITLTDEERTMIRFIANYMRTAHEHLVGIQEPTAAIPPDDPMVLGSSQLGGANGLEWLLH